MLTYGNWYYPDEDPLAKRRKTNKTDSNKAREQTSQMTGSNNMTPPNKPLLTVRRLVGDRLSIPKNSRKNSAQTGNAFRNVGREASNPYCFQGYSVVDPALMFGVRDVRNVWPGRMQIPNEGPRYEYRPPAIARPFPLRFRPVFSSFTNPLAHPGWVRASVSSAFTPVRHIHPEFQTSIVMTEHSSSIQSLSQLVSAVRTGTSTSFTPARIPSSRSSKCQASKPTAQPITTANPSSSQSQESRVKPSRIPVQTSMFSPSSSLRAASQTTCSVTTSEATLLSENLSVNRDFSTGQNTSTGSSTSQASIVTTKPIMVAHPSSIQSPSSVVGSVTHSTTTLSPVDLSTNSARMTSLQSEDFKAIAQPITPLSSLQPQESPKFKPSHIPVEETMFSPSSSLRRTSPTTCSVSDSNATLLPEDLSVSRVFSTVRSTSTGSSTSQTSIVTTKPTMVAHPSSIQSPSSVVGSITDSTTTLSPIDLSTNSARMTSLQSEDFKAIAQPITTPSSLQPQESPSYIPVQTVKISPSSSLRAASPTTVSGSVSDSNATLLPEDLSVNRAFSTVRSTSTESSTSQTSIVTTKPIKVAHPSPIQSSSSVVGSITDSTTTLSPVDLSTNSARMASSGSSQAEDSKPSAQLITTTPPTSLQPQESPKLEPSYIPVQTIKFSPSSSLQTSTAATSSAKEFSANSAFSISQIISSGSQESSTFQPSHIPVKTIMYSPSSSLQTANPSFYSLPTTAVTTSLDEEHSANSAFSTSRIVSSESQESSTFQPSYIPVKTIMYSPSSSLQTTNPSFYSVPAISLDEKHSANSAFSTSRIKSSGSPISQTSIVTTQSVMNRHSPSIQAQESPKFQPSYIPVQTIMYSPPSSFRAANQSLCSTTTTTTTTVTASSGEELSTNSAFNNRIISSGLSKSQAVKPNAQPIRTADPSPSQPQESPKFQSSYVPVQTIMFSPSLRAASQNACSVTTSDTTLLPEDLSIRRAYTTARSISSTSQTFVVNTQPVMAAHSSLMSGSVTDFTTTSSPVDLSTNSARMIPSESSQSEDSKSITAAFSSSLQLQELSKYQCSQLPPERNTISSPPSFQPEESSKTQTSVPTTQSITTVPPVSPNSQTSKLTTHLSLLSKPQSSEPSTSQTSNPTTQPNTSSSLQSSELITTKTSKITTHLLLLSPPRSIQSSELSTSQTSKSTTQPITAASSCSTDSTTTQSSKLSTHLLLLSKPQPLQSSESSQSQNAPLTKVLLISPPISQVASTATTHTTASSTVASSIGGESLSEVALDLQEAVVQSVVGAIKVDIPHASQKTIRRKEDEIEEKDALLQRIYSVPAFGGKTVKGAKFYQEMLTKPKLCHLFKCMGSDCSFTCNQKALFDQHIELHEAKQGTQNETSKDPSEEDDEPYDWQQCAYCCESPIYPTTSLSEHVITEHGYCEYQCAYCFYRALFQNYVDIHQTLAHRKILKNKPRLIFKCKTFSKGPTVENALKKTGRRRCVRPYHCDQCGSEFLITEEFMNHLLKEHQSVTSYTCHICKNVCFKADRLVVHYKLHSYSTYQCAYCLHGTETERKMIFHLCTLHFAQPACLYVRAWEEGKQIQSEDKSKKPKNRWKFTHQLDSLKMISYDIEATRGECTLEEASDEDSINDDRLIIDESQELNDIIAELGITTEIESSEATTPLLKEFPSIGNSTTQNVSVSTLLPNAKFSLEVETESEAVLIFSGSSSNSSSN